MIKINDTIIPTAILNVNNNFGQLIFNSTSSFQEIEDQFHVEELIIEQISENDNEVILGKFYSQSIISITQKYLTDNLDYDYEYTIMLSVSSLPFDTGINLNNTINKINSDISLLKEKMDNQETQNTTIVSNLDELSTRIQSDFNIIYERLNNLADRIAMLENIR